MPDIRLVTISGNIPVKDAPAIHGKDIGFIWGDWSVTKVSVDYETLHDGFVKITNPPVWRDHEVPGWIEWTHCVEKVGGETKFLLTVYADGRPPTIKQVS